MAISTIRLKNSLKHNFDLLDEIYTSGMSRFYDTEIIHIAIHSISIELMRRGVKL